MAGRRKDWGGGGFYRQSVLISTTRHSSFYASPTHSPLRKLVHLVALSNAPSLFSSLSTARPLKLCSLPDKRSLAFLSSRKARCDRPRATGGAARACAPSPRSYIERANRRGTCRDTATLHLSQLYFAPCAHAINEQNPKYSGFNTNSVLVRERIT